MPCWNATSSLQLAPLVSNSASQASSLWHASQLGPSHPALQSQRPVEEL